MENGRTFNQRGGPHPVELLAVAFRVPPADVPRRGLRRSKAETGKLVDLSASAASALAAAVFDISVEWVCGRRDPRGANSLFGNGGSGRSGEVAQRCHRCSV